MQLPTTFNPTDWEPSQGSTDKLPPSDASGHKVVIVASERKPTQDNSGNWYLEFTLQVIEGPHQGAKGPYRLNLGHSNQQTVDIAHKQLSAVCHAIGWMQPLLNTEQIHGKPFRVVVQLQDTPEGREKGYTDVKKVLDQFGQPVGRGSGNQPQQQQQPNFAQQQQPQQNWQQQPQQQAPNWGQTQQPQQAFQQPPQPQGNGSWGQPPQQQMPPPAQQQQYPQGNNPQAAPWNQPAPQQQQWGKS